MGAGASSVQGMEELLQTSYMIGKAISAITFPGMYRIYDFHSSLAPALRNARQFTFFGMESDGEDDDDAQAIDPAIYEHMFHLRVGEDSVYIEDPCSENEAGWTPLHTCCMSFQMIGPADRLIDEMLEQKHTLDTKTRTGPGNFNSGWTALHMACAYGVEPVVRRLIDGGADVNTVNNFGYSPLLEACHRGFVNIVRMLIEAGADMSYIPPEDLSSKSPFVNSPAQSALAESSRCGFQRLVEMLIEAGADKDETNDTGWSALHEACFYNRVETARVLLEAGASVTGRTRSGAMPYHLAGLGMLRTMLEELGGEEAVPAEDDRVDMVQVLKELTLPDTGLEWNSDEDQEDGEDDEDDYENEANALRADLAELEGALADLRTDYDMRGGESDDDGAKGTDGSAKQSKGEPEEALLHSGRMLGDLPSLRSSPGKTDSSSPEHGKTAKGLRMVLETNGASSGGFADLSSDERERIFKSGRRAKGAAGRKQRNMARGQAPAHGQPGDAPAEFLCELTRKLMTDPLRTPLGNTYERAAIMGWIQQQGRICPLTGSPLAEEDLEPAEKLKAKIQQWLVAKSSSGGQGGHLQGDAVEDPSIVPEVAAPKNDRGGLGARLSPGAPAASAVIGGLSGASGSTGRDATADDDLYDF